MYTQCPHCQTLFQVNSVQLKAAQGMVRCGSCHRIFNSLPRLVENLPEIQTGAPRTSAEVAPNPDIPVIESEEIFEEIEIPRPSEALTRHGPMAENKAAVKKRDNRDPYNRSSRSQGVQSVNPTASLPAPAVRKPPETEPPAPAKTPAQTTTRKRMPAAELLRNINNKVSARTKLQMQKRQAAKPAIPEPITPPPAFNNGTIRGNELINASSADTAHTDNLFIGGSAVGGLTRPHLDQFLTLETKPVASTKKWNSTALWAIAIVLLLFLLMFQFIYKSRDELAKNEAFRGVYDAVCAITGCATPLVSEPKNIKIVTDVRSHPRNRDALVIKVILINQADTAQYFPVLELVLSDGKETAVRRFQPIEYIGKQMLIDNGMPPQKPIDITLEILDPFPGKQAVRFELNPLERRN